MKMISGGVCAAKGFKANGLHCGIRPNTTKKDLALVVSDVPAGAAAVYTTNLVKGAPLTVTKTHIADGIAQAVICNSGNANTCNADGIEIAEKMSALVEACTGVDAGNVIVASTGVIGQPLNLAPIEAAMEDLAAGLSYTGDQDAAEAIMTTDTVMKEAAVEFEIGGKTCRLGGMAKGSGMIHPNMATTLCFITTDAVMEPGPMKAMLKKACDESFHALTVDGDTSTNDSLIMLASGASGIAVDNPADEAAMEELLETVLAEMARRIAADGEGAQKTLTVAVKGLADKEEARRVARSICRSNSVKAAFGHGGLSKALVLSAAGAAMADSSGDFSKVECELTKDDEDVFVHLDFHEGSGEAQAYGCDLTGEYVRINGDYRT